MNVINVNDVAPIFINSPYQVNVSESRLVRSSIIRLLVQDKDSNALKYSILTGSQLTFDISTDGTIFLTKELNYDKQDKYNLNVRVSDDIYSADTNVLINVIAVPKPPPKFSQTIYVTSISEGVNVGGSILNVSASNIIPPSSYSIREMSGNIFFSIDAFGIIKTRSKLNYENQKQHIFTIEIKDKRNSGFATVVVNVLNKDDVCPVITPATQIVHITEPVVADTIVAAVQAKDIDSKDLVFTLTGGGNVFKIDQYGSIRTSGYLDIAKSEKHLLIATVTDGVCSKQAIVTVNINPLAPCPDCNKYPFLSTFYETSIYEGIIPTNHILSVATGIHLSTNFSISNPLAASYVTINNVTGIVIFLLYVSLLYFISSHLICTDLTTSS